MKDVVENISNYISISELIEWTKNMIQLPSYGGIENQETQVAEYIHSVFSKEGIFCQLIEVESGRKNIIAKLPGIGGGKTLLFNGHTDTVAPAEMINGLTPVIKEGMLYGRGASDMKGPIASIMGALLSIHRSKIPHRGDIIFAGVIDEEHGSLGTIDLLERGIIADGAIVGEPTSLEVCIAHRGLEWYEFTFIGKSVHGGSQDFGINAISKAVKFINALEEKLIPRVHEKKHSLLNSATINYGVIFGGTQLSTVPGKCTLLVDRRFLPYEDYDQVGLEFQELIYELASEDPDFICTMKIVDESVMKKGYIHAPMETDENHHLVETSIKFIQKILGRENFSTYFPAWSDGGLLSYYGKIPTIILGPGNIEACHSEKESIEVKQLLEGSLIYGLIALEFCNS